MAAFHGVILMTEKFKQAHAFTAEWEGGLSNDKFDKGGITKYGVSFAFLKDQTPAFLRELGITPPVTHDTIAELTKAQGERAFYLAFWVPGRCEQLPVPMGMIVYDFSVNCGLRGATRALQHACNDLGYTPKLKVDGIMGPLTATALASFNTRKGVEVMTEYRHSHYSAIVARDKTQVRFLKGWLNRTYALKQLALSLVFK